MLTAADWPQWRGPDRNGIAANEHIRTNWKAKPPKLLWVSEGMGEGYASMSIVDGRLYTTGNRDGAQAVICADAASGEVQWSTPITDKNPKHSYGGSRCTPTIDGDRLYAVSSDGKIACLKISDGSLVWSEAFQQWGGKMMSGWGFSESPLVDGDWVLCTPGGQDAMVVALNKLDGSLVWQSAIPSIGDRGGDGAGYASIVVSNGGGVKQYVTTVGRGAIGIRAKDGKFLWGYNRVANGTANIPTPIIDGDYVFVSTGYGTGAALLKLSRTDNGGVQAEEQYFLDGKEFQNHHGGMVKLGDYIYAGHQHNKGFPVCLEMKTGKTVWGGKIRPVGEGSAALTCVDGQLIFRYQNGVVALIEATPKGYNLQGQFTPEVQERESWSHPVVVDGKLYMREQNKLMCYDVAG
ncbi:MAG: PQQ-like beta-propeller repeat protein [Planctomycetaceae bacterium]|nr:PQQ-like beta-propeller repeat protein [Planctomycetaceae bacterium]